MRIGATGPHLLSVHITQEYTWSGDGASAPLGVGVPAPRPTLSLPILLDHEAAMNDKKFEDIRSDNRNAQIVFDAGCKVNDSSF